MFGLFRDNKPMVIDAIMSSLEAENNHVELLKKEVMEEIRNGNKPNYIMYALNTMVKHKKDQVTIAAISSREMFQALNKISEDATYDAAKDYAMGHVDGYHISLMKRQGKTSISASMPNKQTLFGDLIESNGGSIF